MTIATNTAPALGGIDAEPPVQEWCDMCLTEPGGDGTPQFVVSHTVEEITVHLDELDGTGSTSADYEVWTLACGHTLSRIC